MIKEVESVQLSETWRSAILFTIAEQPGSSFLTVVSEGHVIIGNTSSVTSILSESENVQLKFDVVS